MTTVVYAQQGDTLDELCLRHLDTTADVTEQTYALNPGLAALGAVLPLGQRVILPDPPAAPSSKQTVSLWD